MGKNSVKAREHALKEWLKVRNIKRKVNVKKNTAIEEDDQ